MKAIRERRLARFEIGLHMINEVTPAAQMILSGLIVIGAKILPERHVVEYVAYGDQFDKTADLTEPPTYKPMIKDLIGSKYHVSWEKA